MLDVLRVVSATEKYKYLKDSVIKYFADSQDQRLQKLLPAASTEGRKPSQVLRHMRTLAGNLATDELLKIKWMNVLPASARSILCVLNTTSLDKLAEAADKLVDTMPATVHAAGLRTRHRFAGQACRGRRQTGGHYARDGARSQHTRQRMLTLPSIRSRPIWLPFAPA